MCFWLGALEQHKSNIDKTGVRVQNVLSSISLPDISLESHFLKILVVLYRSLSLIKFKTDTKYFWKEERGDNVCNLKANEYVMILFE